MAWTTPKTWSNLDPLVASEFNTQFRDNLNALRAQTEDSESKLDIVYPRLTASRLHHAFHSMATQRSRGTPNSALAKIDETLKLTFTALTDEVLFTAHFHVNDDDGVMSFGVWKDSASYLFDLVGGGTADVVFQRRGYVTYTMPVAVSRGQAVTLWPSWAGGTQRGIRTAAGIPMLLMALEVGAFA